MRPALCVIFVILYLSVGKSAWAGDPREGKKIWEDNSCPSCHGLDGRPIIPGVPNFSRGDRMIKPDSKLIVGIARGSGIMPAWRGILKHQAMIDVVAYIRTMRKR